MSARAQFFETISQRPSAEFGPMEALLQVAPGNMSATFKPGTTEIGASFARTVSGTPSLLP